MNSPQKAIFDQARQLVAEQEDNFAYVAQAEVEAVRSLLADSRPWQGNRLQQPSRSWIACNKPSPTNWPAKNLMPADWPIELEQRLKPRRNTAA